MVNVCLSYSENSMDGLVPAHSSTGQHSGLRPAKHLLMLKQHVSTLTRGSMAQKKAYNYYTLSLPNDTPAVIHSPFIQPGSNVDGLETATCSVSQDISCRGQFSAGFPTAFQSKPFISSIMTQMGNGFIYSELLSELVFSGLIEDVLLSSGAQQVIFVVDRSKNVSRCQNQYKCFPTAFVSSYTQSCGQ